jgi:hypothetical protein
LWSCLRHIVCHKHRLMFSLSPSFYLSPFSFLCILHLFDSLSLLSVFFMSLYFRDFSNICFLSLYLFFLFLCLPPLFVYVFFQSTSLLSFPFSFGLFFPLLYFFFLHWFYSPTSPSLSLSLSLSSLFLSLNFS